MNALIRIYPGDDWALLAANVLIQVTVIILAAWLLARVGNRWNAAARHCIYVVALLCVLAGPGLALVMQTGGIALVSLHTAPPDSTEVATAEPPLITTAHDQKSAPTETPPATQIVPNSEHPIEEIQPQSLENDPFSDHPPAVSMPEVLRAAAGSALVLWLLGMAWMLTRWFHGLRLIAGLRRSARPLDSEEIAETLAQVRRVLSANRLPPLAISTKLDRPVMVGLVRPLVILPENATKTLNARDLADVLVHECAHAVCRHQVVGFLQRIAGMLFWPHPLVHLLNRELARAREEVCDNFVLCHGDATRYARTLLELSQKLNGLSPKPVALGLFFHCPWRLEDRVADLLDQRRRAMTRVNRLTAAVLTATFLLVVVLIAGTRISQAEPTAEKAKPSKVISTVKTTEETTEKDGVKKTVITTEKTTEKIIGKTAPPATVKRRAVNKRAKDFPEKVDLSTPESAMAAICRRMARKDIKAAFELCWFKLEPELAKNLEHSFTEDPLVPKNFDQLMLDTECLEVLTYRNDLAALIYKDNGAFQENKNKLPYCTAYCGRINGQWKIIDIPIPEGSFLPNAAAAREVFEKKKDDYWQRFKDIRKEVKDGRLPAFPSARTSTNRSLPPVKHRAVNKRVKDFPKKTDLSTPESAMVAWSRSAAKADIKALNDLSWVKLDAESTKAAEQDLKNAAIDNKNIKQQILDTEIVEVFTYHDDLAVVISKNDTFPNNRPYAGQLFGRIKGKWKNIDWRNRKGGYPRSIAEAAKLFDATRASHWAFFENTKDEIKKGGTPIFKDKTWLKYSLSAAEKKDAKRWETKNWRMGIVLDMPSLDPPAVQYAIFDKDPVPAFISQTKRMKSFSLQAQSKAGSEPRKEMLRAIQRTIWWNNGFKEVTGEELYLLTTRPGGSHTISSDRPDGKKWIVTKTVKVKGKPVCWCIPVELKTGKLIEVTLNKKNAFDLKGVYNKAMKEEDRDNVKKPQPE